MIPFILFLFGTAIGSFMNAFSLRLAEKKNWINARSACPNCKKILVWYELIPIFSFVIQSGKCRSCETKMSYQYLVLEVASGLLFLVAGLDFLVHQSVIELIFDLFLYSVLLFLFLHDLRYYILPDLVTLPGIVIIFFFALGMGAGLNNLLLAILTGAGFFAAQFFLSKGRWIGGGDIRMGGLLGAALGWPLVLVGLMISYLFGSVIAVFLLATKKKAMGSKIPFGTFLALGTLITHWWGSELWQWYLGFL